MPSEISQRKTNADYIYIYIFIHIYLYIYKAHRYRKQIGGCQR